MQLNIMIDDSLMQEARRLNPQRSERELIETALRTWLALQRKKPGNKIQKTKVLSCYDLMKDHIGCIDGPPDLSTNKSYMEGFGE